MRYLTDFVYPQYLKGMCVCVLTDLTTVAFYNYSLSILDMDTSIQTPSHKNQSTVPTLG